MGIIQSILSIMRNGFLVLRSASSGDYREESDFVRECRKELEESGRYTDVQNLIHDRRNVAGDISVSFRKLKLGNG